MAKKQTKKAVAIEEPVVAVKEQPKKKDSWEMKDRNYYLLRGLNPLTYTIRSRGIFYFDEEKGYERELKILQSTKEHHLLMSSKVMQDLGHIVFEEWCTICTKRKTNITETIITISSR